MLITYYHNMSSNQKNNLNGETTSKNMNVGDKAPDFELLDTNQEVHRLSTDKEGLTILAFFPPRVPQFVPWKCAILEILLVA